MNVIQYSKYALSILFIFILYLSYLIVKPLLLTIITAIILVYVFSPLYNLLHTKILKNKYVCSLVVLIIIVAVCTVPLIFLLKSLAEQGVTQFTALKDLLSDPETFSCHDTDLFCLSEISFLEPQEREFVAEFLKNALVAGGQRMTDAIFNLLSNLPSQVMNFFVMLFLMFFLFADGQKLFTTVKNFLPMKLEHEEFLITSLKETTDAVVFGQVAIALLQGILVWIAFLLLGIPHALLLGAFVVFLGVIPFLGPALVWVPVTLYYLATGIELGSTGLITKAVIVALFGIFILGTVENLLKPKIIGDKAKLHPALVFLGVIGGLSLFGFIGFFLGPIILSVFVTLIKIYEKEKMLQLRRGIKI